MALILLIACANVAALMLGQVDARSVEFAVRSALGANRVRLTQPLVAEAWLIATAAGALGAALAWAGFSMITRALPLDKPSRIVGVVADAVERGLTDAAQPVRYAALAQMPWMDDAQSLVLRVAGTVDESALLEPARRTIERAAPGVAVQQTTTMRRVLDMVVVLLSLLTTLAFTLGAVGIYGVITHFAARRRRDWAIKVALGLPSARVITHVVGHGTLLVVAGIGVGVAGAAALTRLLSSFLYGVSVIDPLAFAAAGAALLGVSAIAMLIPAWRAGMTDPVIALREQ
jgi:ABC-type antimicrobial peptide transport system permease subunit